MRPARIYLAEPQNPGRPMIRIVRDVLGDNTNQEAAKDDLFKNLPKNYGYTGFSFVKEIDTADFVLLPQPVRRLDAGTEKYLTGVKRIAAGKPVIVFLLSDLSYDVHIDGVIQFCRSIFKPEKRANEIQGTFVFEDFAESVPIVPRPKRARPIISFCGYAGFSSYKTWMRYVVTNVLLDFQAFVTGNEQLRAYKRGIYFRRAAMAYLKKDERFETRFIARNTFSGNAKLIEGDPERIRREYIENMQDSDFVLAPRGDANHSTRFFEALTLGRIPILVDTDIVLPLEKVIDYDQFMVRVPFTDLHKIGDYVEKWYNALSEEEWLRRQQLAREAFVTYLRYDTYFNFVFPHLLENGPETLN